MRHQVKQVDKTPEAAVDPVVHYRSQCEAIRRQLNSVIEETGTSGEQSDRFVRLIQAHADAGVRLVAILEAQVKIKPITVRSTRSR
jgi:hypothetical protein